MKFGFIAKHRGIWPAGWLCEALDVSRGGFYAWLTRPRSQRSRSDEELVSHYRNSKSLGWCYLALVTENANVNRMTTWQPIKTIILRHQL